MRRLFCRVFGHRPCAGCAKHQRPFVTDHAWRHCSRCGDLYGQEREETEVSARLLGQERAMQEVENDRVLASAAKRGRKGEE